MTRQREHTLSMQERKRLRRIIILVGLVVVLLLLFFPGRSLMSYYRMQKQVAILSRQNALLEQRNRELAAEIKRLQTDDSYLEELARKKYGLLKDNETVYEFKAGRKKSR
jgi:cell division protein FtsB